MFVKGDPDKVIRDSFAEDRVKMHGQGKPPRMKFIRIDGRSKVKARIPTEKELMLAGKSESSSKGKDMGPTILGTLKRQAETSRRAVSHQGFVDLVKTDIEDAETYFEEYILDALLERLELTNASKEYYSRLWPKLSRRCSIVSTDIQDTIEWMLPSMVDIFLGGDEVFSIKGRTEEDRPDSLRALVNWQVLTKNKGDIIFYQWFKDAFEAGKGTVKAWWLKNTEPTTERIVLGIDEFLNFPQELIVNAVELPTGEYLVVVKYDRVTKNQPILKNIPPGEYIRSPEVDDSGIPYFAAHRSLVTASELLRMEKMGIYKGVKQALERTTPTRTSFDSIDEMIRPFRTDNLTSRIQTQEKGRGLYLRYECFGWYDTNGDGILEPILTTYLNGDIIQKVENDYERPPFFEIDPYPKSYNWWGKGTADILGDMQSLKTALIRQIVINISMNNDRRAAIDSSQTQAFQDLNDDKAALRMNLKSGDRVADFIQWAPMNPLDPVSFTFLEYCQALMENKTGMTRYNQGLDARSLNKMLDINTPVPMSDGSYKILADIADGDVIVGRNGQPTTVLNAHPISMPERAYRILLYSGEEIRAGGEHLWEIETQRGTSIVRNTDWLFEYKNKNKASIFIPRCLQPKTGKDINLPIDPYILGIYLGNGHVHSCRVTNKDNDAIDYLKKWCESTHHILAETTFQNSGEAKTYSITGLEPCSRDVKGQFVSNGSLWSSLCSLGITKKTSEDSGEKHIPEKYFHASYESRLDLLRGLMDTDGCHHSGALVVFSQKECRLLDDVYRLIESLGMFPSLHEVDPGDCGKEGQRYFNIHFSATVNPFLGKEKSSKWAPPQRSIGKQSIRAIEMIAPIPMRCLTVDARDGLFCVGKRFTVTHNTATGISMIMQAANQRLKIIAKLFSKGGIQDLGQFLVLINQKFMDQETVVRLTNEYLDVKPDDIGGEFDVEVSAGVNVGSKDLMIQNMFTLLERIYPRVVSMGIAGPEEVYNAVKQIIEQMGLNNTGDFARDPAAGMGAQIPGFPGMVPGGGGGMTPEMMQMLAQQMGGQNESR